MPWGRSRFARDWDTLGQRDAYSAILTHGSEKTSGWDPDEFFASGRRDVDRFLVTLSRIGPGVARRRALDFGCGLGRITRSLAAHFDAVVGVDVAPAMVSQARALNALLPNCEFVVSRGPRLTLARGGFDVVYCRLVLQHVPTRAIRRYIPELIRMLSPGGVLMFQLPERMASPFREFVTAPVLGGRLKRAFPRLAVYGYRSLKYVYVASRSDAHMRMSGLPIDEVKRIIERSNGRLVTAVPDTSHGVATVRGFEYWVTVPGATA